MVRASELLLPGYQRQDGAITLHLNGDRIDPYFASKALLMSYATGLDVQRSATAWIEWAIQQQHSDGLFYRICLENNAYHDCGPADADDAMLAVWVELLTTVAPASGMSSHWQQSMQKAYRYLTTVLYDRQKKIFWISTAQRVGLFMDNTEVYSALRSLSNYYSRLGDKERAGAIMRKSDVLHQNIILQFWLPIEKKFRASMQQYENHGFYPDQTAQIIPLLADFKTPLNNDQRLYSDWMTENKKAWHEQATNDYPWGLIAVAAAKRDDWATVSCWLSHASAFRHGERWNVLEEAVFQGLMSRPEVPGEPEKLINCTSE
ncbi:MAG: hypothetical protein HY272_08820 [Gammaproteobacteria bacterium]|nr:hypothetical protein [Gammaproteobacteria bacterium]